MNDADELRLLHDAIKRFPDAVAVWSADGKLVACSDAYSRLPPAQAGALRRTVQPLNEGGRLELLSDVTGERSVELRLLTYHDTLTGLPNRRLLDDRARQAIRLAQRRDRMVAAVLIRLEDFSDAALREAAGRLARCVRKADTLARAGADEFALVCELKDAAECRVVAAKVLQALAGFVVSIGISLYPGDGGDGDALLRNAEAALLRARDAGPNQVRFFGR